MNRLQNVLSIIMITVVLLVRISVVVTNGILCMRRDGIAVAA